MEDKRRLEVLKLLSERNEISIYDVVGSTMYPFKRNARQALDIMVESGLLSKRKDGKSYLYKLACKLHY